MNIKYILYSMEPQVIPVSITVDFAHKFDITPIIS